ncbi:MAG TPA: GNAT family N-acetyltransferase [Clostridia bacterium]|nr:GNAT family N-acetyltransferase [Clostridia bacterium]
MYKLELEDYKKVMPLLESNNELSVFSVISGIMPGEIYVDDVCHPAAVLIQTSECNLLAGKNDVGKFNATLSDELDFWDPVIPDSSGWNSVIPNIHKNRFVRKYQRRHYSLNIENSLNINANLPDGYCMEPAIPADLRLKQYENSDKLISWIENWGNDEAFTEHGTGCYIRKGNTIVSWSISDCSYNDKIAIGIHTDERFRKKGLGIFAANETVKMCFSKGFKSIDWLCVDFNKGSIAIAEKLGFSLVCRYDAFTPYPPVENLTDLSETEWNEWAVYFENASLTEPQLLTECLFAYIKANNVTKANEILFIHKEKKPIEHNVNGFIQYLHTFGMAADFNDNWMNADI